MPPNLLFITTDHQRADTLFMRQCGIEVTPRLNALARESTQYTRAYTTCPLCVPARTAMATGLYPTRNGVVINDWKGRSAGNHVPLHQHLARAGYDVAHIGVHHVRLQPELTERVAFSRFISNDDYARWMNERGQRDTEDTSAFKQPVWERQGHKRQRVHYSNAAVGRWPLGAELFMDSFFVDRAIDFLSTPRDRPLALFVCLWAPHPPLRLPAPYFELFNPDHIDLPEGLGQPALGEPSNRRQGIAAQLAEGMDESSWRRAWSAHLGLTRLADDLIGRLLDALEKVGMDDDTHVLFTSDHGDHLGQHGMYQKMELYEQALRIPLLVRGPGIRAQQSDALVSHLDLLPTLLDLSDVASASDLDGRSLALHLKESAPIPQRTLFAQYSGNPTLGDIRRGALTERYKYVFDPDSPPELYDLRDDPLEMANIASDQPALCAELHAACAAWHTARGDWINYASQPIDSD